MLGIKPACHPKAQTRQAGCEQYHFGVHWCIWIQNLFGNLPATSRSLPGRQAQMIIHADVVAYNDTYYIMRTFFLTIVLFGSINIFSQELFVDYLQKVPLNQHLDYITISKKFQIDTLWKRQMNTRFYLKSKFIDKLHNVNIVILQEENGVGGYGYLYSFANDGQIIDRRKIGEGFDNADLSGPDYDYSYTLENMLVIINHRLMIPVQPTKDEPYKKHIIENYYTYIKFVRMDTFLN